MNQPPGEPDRDPRPLICTIGDLILDVVVLPRAPLVPDADRPATISLTGGGQAANVAAWASALGARSRLICARGTDGASEIAAAHLRRQGVEICGPVIAGKGGVVVSIREPDGARTMASDPGTAALLEPAAVDPSWVQSADVLHVSGYCLLREPVAQAALAASRAARRVTLDLASAQDIETYGAERFSALVAELGPELIFANEAERAVVPGLRAPGWVIKRGAGGALFPDGHYDAVPAEVADTTGAGDALAAGYLVGGPRLAMVAASRCVAAIGAMPAPTAPTGRLLSSAPHEGGSV